MSILGTIVSDLKKAGEFVKSELVWLGAKAPTIVAAVAKDEAAIAPVIEAFVPGSAAAITLANSLMDLIANAVEEAGSAASANGLAVSLDVATVKSVQDVITAAKAAAAKVK